MPIEADRRVRREQRRTRLVGLTLLLAAIGIVVGLRQREPAGSAPADKAAAPVAEPDRSPLVVVGGVRVLSLAGTPYAVGKAEGLLLKSTIRKLVDDQLFGRLIPDAGLDRETVSRLMAGLVSHLPQTAIDALHGLAEGSGVAYDKLLVLQALPELKLWGAGSAYAALTPATRIKDLLLGYDLDWSLGDLAGEALLVAASREEGELPAIGVRLAGTVGPLAGMNQQGLGLALLRCDQLPEGEPAGLPLWVVGRRLLHETGSIDEARLLLEPVNRTVPGNLMLVQTAPVVEAAAVEVSTTAITFRPPDDGRLVATNHFRALREPALGSAETGACPRYDALRAWLEDHAGSLSRISRPLHSSGAAGEDSLVTTTLQPLTRRLGVAVGAGAAEREPVWLRWDPETGKVTSVEDGEATP